MNIGGAWTENEAAAFMEAAIIPVRLAVLDGGAPLPVSLWFLPEHHAFCCATQKSALVARALERNPQCGFEIAADAPPYRGVRGQGRASLHPDEGGIILARLLERYKIEPSSKLSKLLAAKASQEVAIRIKIDWITSWDFSQRMRGAIKS